MVRMVVFFAFGVGDHGIVAGHARAARPNDGIEIDMRRPGEAIFGEVGSVDFDYELSIGFGDLDATPQGPRRLPRASLMGTSSEEESKKCGENRQPQK